ncbi:MAG: alpha/beta hydrolase [Acidobacteriota bacterium]
MASTVWRDAAARARLEAWYERFVARVGVPVERREVPTRHGPSPILLAGAPDAPVVVCLHPMRTSAAHLLGELGPLAARYRLVVPDLPDQSVHGLQLRLPLADDSLALWLLDVLDGLSLDTVNLFGVSWGGFVARLTASTAPSRVRRLALLVPAGIANGSHLTGLMKMAVPLIRHRLRPSEASLRAVLDPLLTTWDDDWAGYIGDSLRDVPMDMRIPPLASDDALRRLTMPVLVLGGAEDISFPGEAVVSRVKALVPHADGEVIPGCKHSPPTTDEFRVWLAARLQRFLV